MQFVDFFSYFHCYLRDLHSFPTRRSSDLAARSRPLSLSPQHDVDWAELLPPGPVHAQRGAWPRHRTRFDRSEEHTSELQSRRDLVCRLLLEKKKTIKLSHTTRCDPDHRFA